MIDSATDGLQSKEVFLMTATLSALIGDAIAMDCIPAVGFDRLHASISRALVQLMNHILYLSSPINAIRTALHALMQKTAL
jgi:hypothetical protein